MNLMKEDKPDGVEVLQGAEILFGFMGWLTTRKEGVTLGAEHDASVAVDLVTRFCKANNLPETCRDGWDDRLTHPKESK